MNILKHTLAVSALSLFATGASAASYTFDLERRSYGGDTANWSAPNSFSITHGDMTGTFTGRYVDDPGYDGMILNSGTFNDADRIRRWQLGAGVYSTAGDAEHTVDGKGDHDFVEMAFAFMGSAVDVTLSSLSFGWIGGGYPGPINSSFELVLDSNGNATIDLGDIKEFAGDATDLVDLSGLGLMNDVFGVLAGENGSWKLKAATINYSPPDVPEIPLPAAVWLMIGGLGGLVTIGKRRQNAT